MTGGGPDRVWRSRPADIRTAVVFKGGTYDQHNDLRRRADTSDATERLAVALISDMLPLDRRRKGLRLMWCRHRLSLCPEVVARPASALPCVVCPTHDARKCGGWPSYRSEEHTSELQSLTNLVCRLLLEKKKKQTNV